MADWDEIKRLAADFQRAQLSSTIQKLSERNCIEIVQKLIQAQLIDVIYTTDGKEYLTPQEIVKEVREELQIHGGRINLVELQQIINVDFTHVEAKVIELVRGDKSLTLVLGQLIDQNYQDSLAEEVNDKLQEQGQVTIAELAKQYDLPGEFLSETIEERLGTVIQGRVDDFDRDIIFTEAFVSRHKAKIRGAFSAITEPTHVMGMVSQFGLQERLFYSILEELVSSGRLAGSITGGRQDKALYVPEIYTKSQNDWVDSFYKQNGYLEYDALSRLGISDPRGFIKKRFKSEDLQYLGTCCVGTAIRDHIEAEIEEALSTGGWIDVMPTLPSIFSTNDANQILQKWIKAKAGLLILGDTFVTNDKLISNCSKHFKDLMAQKAEKDAKVNHALLSPEGDKKASVVKVSGVDDGSSAREDKRENRRKKAAVAGGGKSGGGTQGREVKMKSTKKKGHRGRADEDSDEENTAPAPKGRQQEIEFMLVDDIEEELKGVDSLKECPEEFVASIAQQLYRPLKREYQDIARSVFLQTVGTATGHARKKTHGELQEKINGLWTNAKLFDKGLKCFPEETQSQLNKHLLKTVCTDITNLVLNAIAAENMLSVSDETQLTPEVRLKLLSKMPDNKTKSILTKLHSSLTGQDLDEFFQQLELMSGSGHLEIVLKKPDKKKERQLLFNHRQALAEQMRQETEPAMALHLASVMLVQVMTQGMVHAPGRCVPQIISFLEEHLPEEQHEVLIECQDLVMKQLKKAESEDDAGSISKQLSDILPKVKDIALTAKKLSAQKVED